MAKAQFTLAALAETLLEEKLSETGITRIEERGKLTSAEKHLSGVTNLLAFLRVWIMVFSKTQVFVGCTTCRLNNFSNTRAQKAARLSMILWEYRACCKYVPGDSNCGADEKEQCKRA